MVFQYISALTLISGCWVYDINALKDGWMLKDGRKLNDNMPKFVAERVIEHFNNKQSNRNVLLLGITFKENCSDIRNSRVAEVYNILLKNKANVDVYDPFAVKNEVKNEVKIDENSF